MWSWTARSTPSTAAAARTSPRVEETVQVLRDGTPGRCTVRVTVEVLDPQQGFSVVGSETHDFLYEQVGERWIFTTFSMVR